MRPGAGTENARHATDDLAVELTAAERRPVDDLHSALAVGSDDELDVFETVVAIVEAQQRPHLIVASDDFHELGGAVGRAIHLTEEIGDQRFGLCSLREAARELAAAGLVFEDVFGDALAERVHVDNGGESVRLPLIDDGRDARADCFHVRSFGVGRQRQGGRRRRERPDAPEQTQDAMR